MTCGAGGRCGEGSLSRTLETPGPRLLECRRACHVAARASVSLNVVHRSTYLTALPHLLHAVYPCFYLLELVFWCHRRVYRLDRPRDSWTDWVMFPARQRQTHVHHGEKSCDMAHVQFCWTKSQYIGARYLLSNSSSTTTYDCRLHNLF